MMDEVTEALEREFRRVAYLATFAPDQRVWWIYLREAAGRWLEKHWDEAVRAAFNRVKGFPENLPDEQARWEDLRRAVGEVIVSGGKTTENVDAGFMLTKSGEPKPATKSGATVTQITEAASVLRPIG